MSNFVWVFTLLALFGAFLVTRALLKRPLSRHLTNVLVSLILLVYFLATAGLGIFWVARQQLPVFEPHYLFGYATLLIVVVHVALNGRIVVRTFFGPPRRRALAKTAQGFPRWLLCGLLLTAVGCGAFTAGTRYGTTSEPKVTGPVGGSTQSRAQASEVVRWYHELSSESRTGALTRAPALAWKKTPPYKTYPDSFPRVALPPPDPPVDARAVDKVILDGPTQPSSTLTLEGLSLLLHHTAGITDRRGGLDFRAAPSSGALFPTEVYVAVRRIDGLEPGIYHYDPRSHQLVSLHRGVPESNQLGYGAFDPGAPAVLVATAVFSRTGAKYGHRAYRYVLADVGHLLENARIAAAELGFSATPLPAFDEGRVAKTLGIHPREEGPLAILPLVMSQPPDRIEDSFVPATPETTTHPLGPTGRIHEATSLQYTAPPAAPDRIEKSGLSLPSPVPATRPLWETIEARRSDRNYARTAMPLEELGSILHTMARPSSLLSPHVGVWVIAHRVEGLAAGAYRYEVGNHSLHSSRTGDLSSATESAVLSQRMASQAAVVIVLTIRGREVSAEGARAYRHAWLEVGLLGQRAYLTATGRGLGVCAAGAFFDDEAAELLKLPDGEWVTHFVMIGRK